MSCTTIPKNMFNPPEYSDVTIKVEEEQFYCHKVILCTKSTYFADICSVSDQVDGHEA
ncbi:Putative BTB/POZ domain-containing protein [Septoria linicola]|uniref:BTB/POZ domain-containing protein n=1 Tax=Septoria linicola TaxID=215465 RepID=A0A9Q9AYI8_9PEZI|nr:putative BTB/POZ domain-containing protein [Septoria linicola]USW52991.1 Putative BTB/POZ domain-containing protein [Septoria linicola]